MHIHINIEPNKQYAPSVFVFIEREESERVRFVARVSCLPIGNLSRKLMTGNDRFAGGWKTINETHESCLMRLLFTAGIISGKSTNCLKN